MSQGKETYDGWPSATAALRGGLGPRSKRNFQRLDAVFSREGKDVSPGDVRRLLGGISRARVSQLRIQWRHWQRTAGPREKGAG